MSQKSRLYRTLKEAGVGFDKHYREYTADELQSIVDAHGLEVLPEPAPAPAPEPVPALPEPEQQLPEGVLRIDDEGRMWLQEEVRKPAYPKPRGRIVRTYIDTGVKKETVQNGEYIETVEVQGDRAGRTSEIRITLPSYQTGIYIDRRFPFKVHTYNDQLGFDFADVNAYYGGAELVPPTVKRMYVSSDLCYDIRSVINAIRAEYRDLQLTGGIK